MIFKRTLTTSDVLGWLHDITKVLSKDAGLSIYVKKDMVDVWVVNDADILLKMARDVDLSSEKERNRIGQLIKAMFYNALFTDVKVYVVINVS